MLAPPLASAEISSPLNKKSYDPTKVYPGTFGNDLLYYRNPKSNWRRGLNGTFPDAVVCRDALKHLKQIGTWSGHFGPGGECGPLGEPNDWALGNRLNYDTQSVSDR
jgi:hypothetical protein